MSSRYVFDTEAIIAFLYDEPGHQRVATLLEEVFTETDTTEGAIAEANASEVFYLVARFEGANEKPTAESLRVADRDIRTLNRRGLAVEHTDWRLVGEIKAHGQLSFADANAVALASDRNATLVAGADDDFDELPVDVSVQRFRNHGV